MLSVTSDRQVGDLALNVLFGVQIRQITIKRLRERAACMELHFILSSKQRLVYLRVCSREVNVDRASFTCNITARETTIKKKINVQFKCD